MNKTNEKTGSDSELPEESKVIYLDNFRPKCFKEERIGTKIDVQAQLAERKRLEDKRYLLHTEAVRWSIRLEHWDEMNDTLKKGLDYELAKYILSFYRADIRELRDNYRGEVNTILSLTPDMVKHLAHSMTTTSEIREKCLWMFNKLILRD